MKIDMDHPYYIIKLILNLFESMLFRFGMRANLPGVGADQALRGKGSWRTTGRKTRFVSTLQINIISSPTELLGCILLFYKQNNKFHVLFKL